MIYLSIIPVLTAPISQILSLPMLMITLSRWRQRERSQRDILYSPFHKTIAIVTGEFLWLCKKARDYASIH
jgi:hypothetical protein